MTLSELMTSIESLPRVEKLQLIQRLATDLARDEAILDGLEGKSVPIWSPYDSYEAAATLLQALHDDKAAS
jgi:hypothetical protein